MTRVGFESGPCSPLMDPLLLVTQRRCGHEDEFTTMCESYIVLLYIGSEISL